MKKLALVLALLVAFLAAGVAAYRVLFRGTAEARTWIVSSYSGAVQVRTGGGDWHDVDMKTPLTDGDRIRTGPDGEATLLRDANQVTVRASTELEMSQLNDDASKMQVAVGQVFVEARGQAVSLKSDAGARVDAKDAGLGMTVRPDGWTQVAVKRGVAEFTSEGETTQVKEGDESHAAPGKPPSAPVPIPQAILANVRFPDADTFRVQLARVEGKADPGARVKVAGRMVDVGPSGEWAADVELTEGVNQIEVEASDALGRTESQRSQPLRVDTTAPDLTGAAFGARGAAGGSAGGSLP